MLLAKLKAALKGSLALGALLLAVLAALVGPGRTPTAAAPAAEAPAPAPRGRVAVFNLTAVVKNCSKFKTIQEETKAELKKYEDRVTKKRAELDDLRRQIQNMPPGAAPELEAKARAVVREIEDVENDAKRQVGEKTDKLTVEIYKDVREAARRYAKDHDLDLVLHYTDPSDGDDALSPANVARKMQAGASVPIYAADGVDVTADLVNLLNGK
jgi:Skp family chaperone for outer membrane proteins